VISSSELEEHGKHVVFYSEEELKALFEWLQDDPYSADGTSEEENALKGLILVQRDASKSMQNLRDLAKTKKQQWNPSEVDQTKNPFDAKDHQVRCESD
jgi:hypothetical protein